MFKKSKKKIVQLTTFMLVLLVIGMLGTICLISYMDMASQNREILQQFSDTYSLNGIGPPARDSPQMPLDRKNNRKLQVSTFYSVAVDDNGTVLDILNELNPVVDDAELVSLAKKALRKGHDYGTAQGMPYMVADKGEYTLIVFIDNTLVSDSMYTILKYTLFVGVSVILLLIILSRFLADRIIRPLERNDEKQRQFISDAGHELKTPIAAINANADLLFREIGENRWLSNIRYEGGRMSEIIGQLLDLARAESTDPKMEPIDLSRIVTREILVFEATAFEKELKIDGHIADRIQIMGNASQAEQLITILLDNAIRYAKKKSAISVTLSEGHRAAILSVENIGDNIPPEHMEHIFERFYQADISHSDEMHYGLGLAIARAIVLKHCGEIIVNSKDGVTRFTVSLPSVR